MRDSQSTHRERDIVGTVWLLALIGAPSAALGAVHAVTAGLFFAAAAAFLVYRYGVKKSTPPAWDLPTVTALGLMGFTAVQILPLPAPLVSVIAPSIYDVRSRVWSPMGLEGPGWMPLSLDVSLTVVELGKIALYLAVYWGAVSAVRRFGPGSVLRVLTAAGLFGAVVLLAHKILMLDKVYGLYAPIFVSQGAGRISAPLVNENHMAAFLGLCSLAAVGRATGRRERSARIAGFSAAAFIGGALMLTLSRGGIAAFVAAQSLFVVMRIGAKRSRFGRADRDHWAWLFVALALSLGLGFFVAQDAIVGEFLNGNVRKIDLFFEGLPLAGQFWTTGVGRGAFWVGFHMVSGLAGGMTVTHAENAPVQLLADWGIPVGAAALGAAAWMVGRFLLRPPKRPEGTAAAAALVGFGIHNLVDFNMEIPGVAVAAAALLGVLYGGERREVRSERSRVGRGPLWTVAGIAVLSAGAALFYVRVNSVDATERRFQIAYSTGDAEVFSESALKPVLNRHPAVAYLPFLKGVRLYHRGTGNPMPWLARAIALYPRFAAAHFYVGGTLLKLGRLDQAMLEFRLAAREERGLASGAARLLVSREPRFETLSRWAVTDADKQLLWPTLARELSLRGHVAEADLADDAVLAVNPSDRASCARRIRRLIARGEFATAEAAVEKMAAHPKNGITGTMLSAELHQKTGDYERAVRALDEGIARFGEHPDLVRALAWARQRNGDFDGALAAAAQLKARAGNAGDRMRAAMLAADLHIADGRIQGALARLREAYGVAPGNTGLLRRIFQLADRHGDRKRAVEALRLLARLEPDDPVVKAELDAYEKKAAMRKLSVDSDIF